MSCVKGSAKTGGRKKGTPNKVTKTTKEVIANLLDDYSESGLMQSDFRALEPKDRMYIAERLMNYTTPKMQSVAMTGDKDKPITIEQKLRDLAKMPD